MTETPMDQLREACNVLGSAQPSDHAATLRFVLVRISRLVGDGVLDPSDARAQLLTAATSLIAADCACTHGTVIRTIDDALALAVTDAVLSPVRLHSFGYRHLNGASIPHAERTEDVRDRLPNPASVLTLPDVDGRDTIVQTTVLNIEGARELLANLVDYARLPMGPRTIAIGCSDGKVCAPSLVELLARELRSRGRVVEVKHHHVDLPHVLAGADQ